MGLFSLSNFVEKEMTIMPDLKVKKIYPSEGEIEEYQKASKEIGNLKTHRKDALLNTFNFPLITQDKSLKKIGLKVI